MFGSFPGSLGRTTNQVYRCEGADAVMESKERHNVAHGVKPWVGAPCLCPFRRRGEGLRTQGSRPGLRYSAASRLSNRTPGSLEFYERTSVTGRLAVRARGAILAEPRSLFFRGGRT